MKLTRRSLLSAGAYALAGLPLSMFGSTSAAGRELRQDRRNFRFVYSDAELREEFRDFLVNVFHLYPDEDLHALIGKTSALAPFDREAYFAVQSGLDDIDPVLAEIRYALPALRKQKTVIAAQTVELLGVQREFEGSLEFGSGGRYLDALEEALEIRGERYVVAEKAPAYSPIDIVDRGQLPQAGRYVPLDDYETPLADVIAPASLDLVTMYIGFHHCPIARREGFFASIRAIMKPGASLIVRDHNARDEKMLRIIGLAHDVFNLGTRQTWDHNERELRNFYSLDSMDHMLRRAGFKSDGRRLYQDGDPTLNALMRYVKV